MTFTCKSILAGTALAFALTTSALAARTDLTLAIQLEPPHLDPTAGAAGAIDDVTYANIFQGLTRITSNGAVAASLAESWRISDDGLVYTFKLHDGVLFHDGTALDAGDVVFSYDRARAEGSTNAQTALFSAIESVEAVDDLTVKVTLSHPQGSFLYNMGWGDAVIVAPESADTNKEKPIGTGPFKFDSWAKGSAVTLVKNPDYWGEPVALDKAVFRVISDPAAATAALLAGDIQAFPAFPAPEAVIQFENDPRFTVVIGSTEGETILSTNNGKPPFDDVRVRQAIAHALDRQAIIDGAMFGFGTPIGTHFAPHNPAYVELVELYPYDPAKSKELLAEAGYPDGFEATLKLPPPTYARRGGEIIAAQLREVGINLEIIPVEWAQWLDQVFKAKDYDLTIVSHTEPNDIGIYVRDDYYFDYHSDELKQVMAELDVTADEDKRSELLRKAQEIISADAVNGFLFELPKIGIWDAKLQGLWHNMPIQADDLTDAYWAD
ncbi:ABC transporter substrate-binding protein [Oricola sp.]|uniref:ABC transporter substrate-binding protein n=1 Tax=Oricola sp. TaxID=1979950 RepID=UPI0025DD6719|nr:ABC transporter substrate-binding protein [Oricola sp.]MCI5076277.1 ABC transporter substrate-binding protein [Oricola sp.]